MAFLRSDRIYILPTGHGIAFLCSIVVMVLTAATYSNNLIYILAFVLFGVVLISMVQTNVNLKGIELSQCQIPDGFQGEEILVHLSIKNTLYATRENLSVSIGRPRRHAHLPALAPSSTERVTIKIPAQKRGRYELKRAEVSTVYPLGLFRAWKILDVKKEYFVVPKPLGTQDPSHAAVEFWGQQASTRQTGPHHGADFHEHRNFQSGDSFQHVDWKAYARNRPLLVKQFEGDAQQAYRFQMPTGEGPAVEAALSQLTLWILTAESEGAAYELRDSSTTLAMHSGFNHCQMCLRRLATYGLPHG